MDYMVSRVRLLHAWQTGQPGGIGFGEEQYVDLNRTRLAINPAEELVAMHLSRAETSSLVPHLADEDYVLAFSFFRDFMPERHLYRVNDVLAEVINETTQRTSIDLADYYALPAADRPAWLLTKAKAVSRSGLKPGPRTRPD
jgi:hypothetical protein